VIEKTQKYKGLKILSMDDKEGYEAVRLAKADCVSTRTEFVATCKTARDEANKYSQFVIDQEKLGVAAIKEVEDALAAEKAKIDDEVARIKAEKAEKEAARVKVMADALRDVGFEADAFALQTMDKATFDALLLEKTESFRIAEELRIAAEAKAKSDALELETLRAEKAKADEEKNKAAKEAEAKALADRIAKEAVEAAEAKRKQEEDARIAKEAADQKRLAEVESYKAFLFKNGVTEATEANGETKIVKSEGKILIYRLVDTFIIPA
jgi:hypothetical protein